MITQTSILNANLSALRMHSPEAADRALAAAPRGGVRAIPTDEPALSVELDVPGPGQTLALASRRRPLTEAQRLAEVVDLAAGAVFVVNGFGAGHHVRELARRVDRAGLVVVFEPNVDLLRSVLERVDHSAWLASSNVRVLTDADDRAAMSEALRGCEGLVGLGVVLVEHAPSRGLIGNAGALFFKRLSEVVDAAKMAVLTSLVQVRQTLRNVTQNLDRYADSDGIEDLRGIARGKPAIVVSAGPSLARNVDLLSRKGVGERFVIVAVQTVLKTLLRKGIRPHVVTALDYSEISRRFYEGLSASDVRGITLVVEAKVNPAVLEAWPGHLRMCADANLDRLLGEGLAMRKGVLPAGATVAHLAYYFARFLGCNPVGLVGQDLGFSDGQYYGDGAAIHEIWGGELNGFNTLEMLEWQRIVRMGPHLRRATDVLGRPIFSDEQMTAYLAQFERDFKADAADGLTTIDASEGGVRKQHTKDMTLHRFLAEYDRGPIDGLERIARVGRERAESRTSAKRSAEVESRVGVVRQQAFRIGQASRRAESLLSELIEHHADQQRVNRTIDKLERVTRDAVSDEPGYTLVHTLSQIGTFNRVRSDRLIHIDRDADALTRQRRQAERDRENVRTLAQAADELGRLLDDCSRTLRGGPRLTRDARDTAADPISLAERAQCVCRAVVSHTSNDCAQALGATLARLGKASRVDAVVIATTDERIARAGVEHAAGLGGMNTQRVRIVCCTHDSRTRYRSALIDAARAGAMSCWRGGIGNASVFDEAFDPVLVHAAFNEPSSRAGLRGAISELRDGDASGAHHACLVVGASWTMLDPHACDLLIERFGEDPASKRLVFSQAPPGLGACVIGASLLTQLKTAAERAGNATEFLNTSIGAMLGYNQLAPINDLIASGRCVDVPPFVRDAGVRLIPDTPARQAFIERIASLARGEHAATLIEAMGEVVLPADARETFPGGFALADELVIPAEFVGEARAIEAINRAADLGARPLVTIDVGDAHATRKEVFRLGHQLEDLIALARRRGLRVHVRTGLEDPVRDVDLLLTFAPEIVSVDLLADSSETYRAVSGRTDFDAVRSGVERLLAARANPDGFDGRGVLLVVPRLMRCDAAYPDVETFYHRWLHFAGWAVIDPPRGAHAEGRIRALTVPAHAARRLERTRWVVGSNGVAPSCDACIHSTVVCR